MTMTPVAAMVAAILLQVSMSSLPPRKAVISKAEMMSSGAGVGATESASFEVSSTIDPHPIITVVASCSKALVFDCGEEMRERGGLLMLRATSLARTKP